MDLKESSGSSKGGKSVVNELNLWPTFAATPESGGGTRFQIGLMGFN